MRKSHELLLKLYYDHRFRFTEVTVCYVDRGAPNDCTCVRGDQITHLNSYYMEITTLRGQTAIPYHRIRKIQYRDETLWERYPPPPPEDHERTKG